MRQAKSHNAFTLIEVLLAVTLLVLLGTMAVGSLQGLVSSTSAANEALESLHQGEVLINQVVQSLRSAAYFDSNPSLYTFTHEPGTGSPPDDIASWVSSSMALLPPNYPTREGLNRIFLSIEEIDGQTGLAVSAYPYLVDPEDDRIEEVEPWLLSSRVEGLRFRFYDLSENDWVDEWERDNQLPVTLEIQITLSPSYPGKDAHKITRRVDIPVGKVSRATRRGRRQTQDANNNEAPGR